MTIFVIKIIKFQLPIAVNGFFLHFLKLDIFILLFLRSVSGLTTDQVKTRASSIVLKSTERLVASALRIGTSLLY